MFWKNGLETDRTERPAATFLILKRRRADSFFEINSFVMFMYTFSIKNVKSPEKGFLIKTISAGRGGNNICRKGRPQVGRRPLALPR